jgi:hypothetical protein
MKPGECQIRVHILEGDQARRDVERGHASHHLRMIEREPKGDTRTAIVAYDVERVQVQRGRQLDHVRRTRTLAVNGMILVGGTWLAALAIAAKVEG